MAGHVGLADVGSRQPVGARSQRRKPRLPRSRLSRAPPRLGVPGFARPASRQVKGLLVRSGTGVTVFGTRRQPPPGGRRTRGVPGSLVGVEGACALMPMPRRFPDGCGPARAFHLPRPAVVAGTDRRGPGAADGDRRRTGPAGGGRGGAGLGEHPVERRLRRDTRLPPSRAPTSPPASPGPASTPTWPGPMCSPWPCSPGSDSPWPC
jgi:hypothetical protein